MANHVAPQRKVQDRTSRQQLKEQFGYKNVHQIPKLEKVVINMSVGDAIANSKALDVARQRADRRSRARSRSSPRRRSRSRRSSCAKA